MKFIIASLSLLLCLNAQAFANTPSRMKERLQACTSCHGAEGRASSEGYYPRIAGKPEAYLYMQLLAFRDGSRKHVAMNAIVQNLSSDYLLQMARYFAQQNPPYPAPAKSLATATELALGKQIVFNGKPEKEVPACVACHGQTLTGVEPATPGLLGLPRDYLNAQMGRWGNGQRKAAQPDCMADIIGKLEPAELNAASAWLASQAVPANPKPSPALSVRFPVECGSHTRNAEPATRQVAPEPIDIALLNAQEKRGAYLARLGNCAGCHTPTNSPAYSGGRAIETPYGPVYSSNLTPAMKTGLGSWSADDFYKAMHEGVSKNGHYLYPAFPFTNYTRMTRDDVNAIFSFLKKLPAVEKQTLAPELKFPFNQRSLLVVWRALYFKPGEQQKEPSQTESWNRGSYLVNGLGHCGACHTPRTALGGSNSRAELSGGTIPVLNWFAPALNSDKRHGLGKWSESEIVAYLKNGQNTHAASYGPMSEVVVGSLQFYTNEDLHSIATYLKTLPPQGPTEKPSTGLGTRTLQPMLERGASVYANACANCHGKQGEGVANTHPALRNNSNLNAPNPANVIRMVLNGGFPPSTIENPYPHGMPPYRTALSDVDVAAVVTFVRQSWGNTGSGVAPAEINTLRSLD